MALKFEKLHARARFVRMLLRAQYMMVMRGLDFSIHTTYCNANQSSHNSSSELRRRIMGMIIIVVRLYKRIILVLTVIMMREPQ